MREAHDVRAAWEALTNPKNVLALESLYYQLPEGPLMETARKALQMCRAADRKVALPNPAIDFPVIARSVRIPDRTFIWFFRKFLHPKLLA